MKIKHFIFSITLTLVLITPGITVAGSPSYSWTPEEMSAYADISQKKCLNIVVGDGHNILYNGEVVEATDVQNPLLQDAKVAGNKMGYFKWYSVKTKDGEETHQDLIINNSVVDSLVQTDAQTQVPRSWSLNNKFTAYTKPIFDDGDKNPKVHLFFNDKDLGEIAVMTTQPKVIGDTVFYVKNSAGEYHTFMGEKDLGKDVVSYASDGKTIALIKKIKNNYWLYVNGKAKTKLSVKKDRPAPALPDSLVVENGKVIYAQGPDYAPQIYINGKFMGIGDDPHFVNGKILYVKTKKESDTGMRQVIYGKQMIGYQGSKIDVAGTHFAFLDSNKEGTEMAVHIDNQKIPTASATYVRIAQKLDCAL